jgi:hypothetical protein
MVRMFMQPHAGVIHVNGEYPARIGTARRISIAYPLPVRRLIPLVMTFLLATACAVSPPPGTDGDLANHWPSFAEPVSYLPKTGDCVTSRNLGGIGLTDSVVACTGSHEAEVVFVGNLDDSADPPYPGAATLAQAWKDCDKQASIYLGRPWTDAMIRLRLAMPSTTAWESGARWVRCDVLQIEGFYEAETTVMRTGSLRGAVPDHLMIGCVQEKEDKDGYVESLTRVPCSSPHNAEYGGSFRGDGYAFPMKDTSWRPFYGGCDDELAGFLGVSDSAMYKFGNLPDIAAVDQQQWKAGQHVVRCYVWMSKNIKKSVKGSHGSGVPTM